MREAIAAVLIAALIIFSYPAAAAPTDEELLAELVASAFGDEEPYICRVAFAAVMLNRAADPRYPSTVAGVAAQYRSLYETSEKTPAEMDRAAAAAAVSGVDPTFGATIVRRKNDTLRVPVSARLVLAVGGCEFYVN
jgi:spore germination cell wall hydrolase CwlJ-like protein